VAKAFTKSEWKKILDLAKTNAEDFGLPKRSRKSVVLGSFNIRKLGKKGNKSAGSWELLSMIGDRFDLLAIQETQDNLEGIRHFKKALGSSYGLVVSDVTGAYPGERGNERLAFLFNWTVVQRTEVASDITYDRTKVSNVLFEKRKDFSAAFKRHAAALTAYKKKKASGKSPKKPAVPNPHFLTFIRQPHCVSFEIGNEMTTKPYEFLAVNCHLLYGDDEDERFAEFKAIVAWMVERAKNREKMYYENMLFMGDCNLDFENPKTARPIIDNFLKSLNKKKLGKKGNAEMNFPFLDKHPALNEHIRTNVRQKQTYDQIALIFRDKRLPDYKQNAKAGKSKPDGYNYGVFNFVDLIAHALYKKKYKSLSKTNKKYIDKRVDFDVSDHMPIWIRLPMPE
jgi:exonuclease III